MATIQITLTLYGPLAKFAGGKYIAQKAVELEEHKTIRDLMDKFEIPYDQKSYLFINNILSDMPGLNASLNEALKDNARVGIFSQQHMYPYQYRDGLPMSDALTKELSEREGGAMHNTYS
ncbi:MAG: MoaD/ThiS family protein [Anaerolineae bacterium]|jgi:hypothetical protein|nr:MoaD/ThiS family protein [Anaerolineae bacterium]MBT3714765.1 MoaD/ThiS family protein [Anaerolineae bacterium]MBT4309520.1 MoaD/ThiS family protein [Anaerolineae bacterium]MBT4457296.1 MoaD/ThiS family protein [Anaerolineae bacterium]MBT4842997.1 MoaD/ThiS family protein [Anaerolineae bacterium]